MIFRPELAKQVMAGSKTVTRRLCSDNPRSPWSSERCSFEVGGEYAVQPGRGKARVGTMVVRDVRRQQLGHLMPGEARREGFSSVPEFEQAWIAINGSYDPLVWVWRVEFEVST